MKHAITKQIPVRYLREAEAAEFLALKRRTLQNMRWKGAGPAFLKQGRRVIYRIEDLEDWMRQRAVRKICTSDAGTSLDKLSFI